MPADAFDLIALSDMRARIVEEAAARVVAVCAGQRRFSGFVWKDDLVATADEPLPHGGEVHVAVPGGASVAAEIAGRDATTDIALLRAPGIAAAGEIAWKPAARPGQSALVVGSDGEGGLAAAGIVSRAGPAWRSLRGGRIDARIELDARMPATAEGGLALAADGGAYGMAVFGPRRRVLVIPGATIERTAPQLEANGRIPRGYLGLGLAPIRLDGGGRGLLASSVEADGPAAQAGLFQGDVLTGFDGAAIRSPGDVVRALDADSIGRSVEIAFRRGGQDLMVALTIGERPPA